MKFSNQEISECDKYIQIKKENIPQIFQIVDNNVYLRNSGARPFKIEFPLNLDENIAKISAMILDGTPSKKLTNCMFSQKKDKTKVTEFFNIIQRLFNINGKTMIDERTGTSIVNYFSKAFVSFLYHCLDIHKSDEEARIPYWVWNSPKSVITEYLRYAFAMEGSVSHYLKGSEIRFHSVDLSYLKELKKFLKDKFNIDSAIQKYYIKGYGYKYYLMFSKKKDIFRFSEIGFAIKSHQEKLNELISYLKTKRSKTNPTRNEEKIIEFLKSRKKSYRNEIARELKIDPATIHDVLIRLIKKGKIKYIMADKFQRKFYMIKN